MILRLYHALLYSLAGVRAAFKDEPAFRLECLALIVALPAAFFVHVTAAERALLLGSALLVPSIELLNTAIEAIVDLASPEFHPLAKKAKDAASAAVLLSCIAAAAIWAVILFA